MNSWLEVELSFSFPNFKKCVFVNREEIGQKGSFKVLPYGKKCREKILGHFPLNLPLP